MLTIKSLELDLNLSQDGVFSNKKGFEVVELLELARRTTLETRELLNKKGFPTSLIHNFSDKIVLLNSEISELADAVKKKRSLDEEGSEIADIVIRACNITCSDELQSHFIEYLDSLYKYNHRSVLSSKMYVNIGYSNSLQKNKYNTMELMTQVTGSLTRSIRTYQYSRVARPINNEDFESALFKIRDDRNKIEEIFLHFMNLICLCKFYSDEFLATDLQELVSKKMNVNFDRPFQFNSPGMDH